jgi:hypothetical protein
MGTSVPERALATMERARFSISARGVPTALSETNEAL